MPRVTERTPSGADPTPPYGQQTTPEAREGGQEAADRDLVEAALRRRAARMANDPQAARDRER